MLGENIAKKIKIHMFNVLFHDMQINNILLSLINTVLNTSVEKAIQK